MISHIGRMVTRAMDTIGPYVFCEGFAVRWTGAVGDVAIGPPPPPPTPHPLERKPPPPTPAPGGMKW